MRSKHAAWLGSLAVAALVLVGLFRKNPDTDSVRPNPSPAASVTKTDNHPSAPRSVTTGLASPVPNDPDPAYTKKFLEITRTDPDFEWRQPISFWGKVEDDRGEPVAAADINHSWTDLSSAGSTRIEAKSDADGRFELTDQKGKRLSVLVSKNGYHQVPASSFRSFEYANPWERFRPDSNRPVVFRLHRMGAFVSLRARMAALSLPNDGREVSLDWLTDKMAEHGAFKAQITVEPEITNAEFGWHFKISIPGGGFLAVKDDELPLLAPEDGYEETLEFRRDAESSNARASVPGSYYVAFGQPRRYGRIKLELVPKRVRFYKDSLLWVRYWINPSGSRSLEGDPRQGIPNIDLRQEGQ
jgi:hypothetical protein